MGSTPLLSQKRGMKKRNEKAFLFKNGPHPASFCLFSSFQHDTIPMQIDKSIDGGCARDSNPGRQDGRRSRIQSLSLKNGEKSLREKQIEIIT